MLKPLLRHPRARALGARVLGGYLALALRTTRWTLHGADHLGAHLLRGPAIFAFWHERLPLMPALWTFAASRRGPADAHMHVLVSRHSDGRLIGAIMRRFGVGLVHGSSARDGSQRGGGAALRALLAVLAAGDQVVITPDGPRGPRRQPARGVAQLAALAGVPILPVAAQTTRHRLLPTWDSMILPLPLARGALVCGPPIAVPREGWAASLPAIAAALDDAADEADRLCAA